MMYIVSFKIVEDCQAEVEADSVHEACDKVRQMFQVGEKEAYVKLRADTFFFEAEEIKY